jgi:formamidase
MQPEPVEPCYSNYLIFQGISVDETNKQYFLNATLAYRQACLRAIRYVTPFGYTEEQAYCLLAAASVEGRIRSIVDIPNACCTQFFYQQIFFHLILHLKLLQKLIKTSTEYNWLKQRLNKSLHFIIFIG